MSETEIETQGQKPKTSKLAIASILIPTITTIVIPCFVIGFAEAEGFWLTLVDNSPFVVLASWPVGLILGIVALVVIKKSNGLLKGRGVAITGIVLSSFFIVVFAVNSLIPSMLVQVKIDNNTDHELNIFWIDLLSRKTKYISILPREKSYITLCTGESRKQLEENVYIILASDIEGNIYYQEKIRVGDIEIGETIVIQESQND